MQQQAKIVYWSYDVLAQKVDISTKALQEAYLLLIHDKLVDPEIRRSLRTNFRPGVPLCVSSSEGVILPDFTNYIVALYPNEER